MQDASTIKFTRKALDDMSELQLKALREQVCGIGVWDDKPYDLTIYSDFGTLMISGLPIVLGIEPDGYTHS